MDEPRIEVRQVPSLFAEAMEKAQAQLDAERAHLSPEARALAEKFDRDIDEAAAQHFLFGE